MQLSHYNFSSGLKVGGVIVLFCLLVMAQKRVTQITGRVTDRDGTPISDVRLIIKNKKTGVEQEVITDRSGIFKASVRSGVYQVTVDIPWELATKSNVVVSLGESKTVNFK